jgi:hypothetical protein
LRTGELSIPSPQKYFWIHRVKLFNLLLPWQDMPWYGRKNSAELYTTSINERRGKLYCLNNLGVTYGIRGTIFRDGNTYVFDLPEENSRVVGRPSSGSLALLPV